MRKKLLKGLLTEYHKELKKIKVEAGKALPPSTITVQVAKSSDLATLLRIEKEKATPESDPELFMPVPHEVDHPVVSHIDNFMSDLEDFIAEL